MYSFLILLVCASTAFSSDVIDLGDSDFEASVKQYDISLVEFFAPWCGHCKRLAPEYETAATALKVADPPVPLIKVDCTEAGKETCSKYGVSGYPTLKIFKKGEFNADYNGPRDAAGIEKYMKAKSGPSSRELKTQADLDRFIGGKDSVVVGFFSSNSDSLFNTFMKAADAMSEDLSFAHSFESSLAENNGGQSSINIVLPKRLHSKFESAQKKFSGADDVPALKTWIQENIMGLAGHRTANNLKFFESKPIFVVYYNVDYTKNAKGTNYWRNRIMKVATKVVNADKKATFAVSNSQEMSYELAEFGVDSPDNNKVYATAKDEKNQKFVMEGDFNMETFERFLNDFFGNKLAPYLKSEPVPEKNDEPVKVVVAKNFDEIVNDKSKDVLIEFYAPWCGHCKSLAPKYDELAAKLQGEKEITIAKMDATANDVPSTFQVQGFPTLFWVPKDNKNSPKQYNGGREVKDFIEYIARESTNPLTGFSRSGTPLSKTEL